MQHKNYETVVILSPVLDSKQVESKVRHFKEILTRAGGKITHHESKGMQRLAYKIGSYNQGLYQILTFAAPPTVIVDLEIAYQRDEDVIRFLTVSLPKEGVAYLTKQRNTASEPIQA